MIIAGNSHVSVFRHRLKHKKSDAPVAVKWVGAITVDHFVNQHSAAQAVTDTSIDSTFGRCRAIACHSIPSRLPNTWPVDVPK